MARITLTNNKEKFEKDIALNKKAGLNDYQIIEIDDFHLAVFKKRIIKTENLLKFDNGDFVSAVGTIIYKELFAEEALKKLYNDFDENISEIRKKSIGNYNVCIKKNDVIYFFTDKYNLINAYYYNSDSDWFISNSLSNTAILKDKLEIDENVLIEQSLLVEVVGNETMFKNIRKLYGNELIYIDPNNKLQFKEVPYKRKRWNNKNKTLDEIVKDYTEIVKDKARIISSVFGENIRIQQTGGLDSRSIHAAFKSVDCKLKTMYGIGNSLLTNTKQGDLDFNKLLDKKYKTALHLMNWKTDLKSDIRNWRKLFNKHGFSYLRYGGNKLLFDGFDGMIPDYPELILTGDFGENLKLREWATEQNKEYLPLDEILDGYYIKKRLNLDENTFSNYISFINSYKEKLIKYCNLFAVDYINGISLGQFDFFRYIHAKETDSLYVNMISQFSHSILFYGLEDLFEFPWDVSAEFRKNSKFQLNVIKSLYPEFIELPIFSHCNPRKLNNDLTIDSLCDNKIKSNPVGSIKRKYPRLFSCAKSIYRTFKPKEEDAIRKEMTKLIYRDLKEYNVIKPEKFGNDVKRLVRYTQYLYGIKWIMEEKKNNAIK